MSSTSIAKKHSKGSTFIWLAYTGFFLIDPIFRHSRPLWLAATAGLTLFFVLFFIYIRTTSETVRRSTIVAIFVLGLLCFPWNAGASTFFIYTAGFLPFSFESTLTIISLFGVEVLCISAEAFFLSASQHPWLHVAWPNAIFASFLLLVVGGGNIFFAQQRRADCKLQRAQEENVALAALAERERIARDLHDVLGHTLSVIVLKAELAGRLLSSGHARDPVRAATEIAEVERTARTALVEVREAIGGYRARGLLAEIEAARHTLEAAGVSLQCDAMPTASAGLRANEETVLALALREAVTNIVRHARATTCTLRFAVEDGQHRLLVEDNGQHQQAQEGNGLRGMRERVEALGGNLSVDRDAGTRLLIALPLHAEAQAG